MKIKSGFALLALAVLVLTASPTVQAKDTGNIFDLEGIKPPPAQNRLTSATAPLQAIEAMRHDAGTAPAATEQSQSSYSGCLSSASGFSAKMQADLCDVYKPRPPEPHTLWSWDDAVYAYGDTDIKVTIALALLAGIQFVRRNIFKKSGISDCNTQKPAGNSGNICHAQPEYLINKRQRFILAMTAIVMVAMLLFPPFHRMYDGHEVEAIGYHFGLEFEDASVDREMLRIQLVVTFLVGLTGAVIFQTRKPRELP